MRERERENRASLRDQQQLEKQLLLYNAASEVQAYESYISRQTSVHKQCGPTWDWQTIAASSPNPPPQRSDQLEIAQRKRESDHAPNFIDRLLGRAESKRRASERAIVDARATDDNQHSLAMEKYQIKLAEWQQLKSIANGVLGGDVSSFRDALEKLNPLQNIHEIGQRVVLSFNEEHAEATIFLHPDEQIPCESKTLLQSGKSSVKKMSQSSVHVFYQTHVCSAVLRVARELFAVLPFSRVFIHGACELLNTRTGHQESAVIISVLIPRSTFDRLDFEMLDPTDSLQNFVHHVDFAKSRGFAAVEKLSPDNYSNVQGGKSSNLDTS